MPSNWVLVGLARSRTQFHKMKINLILTTIFTLVLLESVAGESKTSEDVLRELHSKFAKYNKDIR